MRARLFLCDKDLASILECSQSTITRYANGRTPKKESALAQIVPVYVGNARRWRKSDVAKAIGISEDEIDKCL